MTYRTLEWSAHAHDFESAMGTVRIPAGATTASVTIQVRGDTQHEGEENFFVEWRGTRRGSNAHAISIVGILDDD